MAELVLPYRYTPRAYQAEFWQAMMAGKKRAFLCWHRQSGKDKTAWNFLITQAILGPVAAQFYYFAPTYSQGKKIIWDGIDPANGMRFLDHIPEQLVVYKNVSEMQVQVRHVSGEASLIQVIGVDNIDSLRGVRPYGCVFSEYAFMRPTAWEIIEPILLANNGWAVFVTTPYGKNHAYKLWGYACRDPEQWYTSLLTIRDTRREDGSPVISEDQIARLRDRGVSEETIQREYYCSFSGSVEGAYYARLLDQAYEQGRITDVPYDPRYPVETWWDLGMHDYTAIWFTQRVGARVHVIDYLENQGEGLPFYASALQQRQYVYSRHLMPHDVSVREWATGITRYQTAVRLGVRPVVIVPKMPLEEGIQAVRMLLPVCVFDRTRCARGLDALQSYTKVWDEDNQAFKAQPLHNWASHAADAFRTGAVGSGLSSAYDEPRPIEAELAFDPFAYDRPGRHKAETDFEVFKT